MALVLPVDEDSLLFRVCLYVGVALLLTDIFIPLVFRRRIRLVLPWQRADGAPARRRLWLPQRGGRRPVNTQVPRTREQPQTPRAQDQQAGRKRRIRKRVSFADTPDAQYPADDGRQVPATQHAAAHQSNSSTEQPSVPEASSARQSASPLAGASESMAQRLSSETSDLHQRRLEPMTLVDDDFPWRLPSFAKRPQTDAARLPTEMNLPTRVLSDVRSNEQEPDHVSTATGNSASSEAEELALPVHQVTKRSETPQVIRRMTFDDAMMALATPETTHRVERLSPHSRRRCVTKRRARTHGVKPHDAILEPHQQPRTELYRDIIRVNSLVFVVQQYEATAKPQPLRLPTLC
ncbi:hypothetical protein ATCC90586_008627 [Pythium insidiosum]|nr:hypothetical protein ATCC90586_008627 [Pythium insidiosum]